MSIPRTIIVTGANRGIGRAICNLILAKQAHSPLKLIATSRKGDDLGLEIPDRGCQEVVYRTLDIGDGENVQGFAEWVRREHASGAREGVLDVLINNAGVNLDAQYGPANAKRTLDVNYRGTLKMCQTFIPSLTPAGRIVNLSSIASTLKPYSAEIQARFRNPGISLADLDQLVGEFERSVATHTESTAGFAPNRAYGFSKSCVNEMTRVLARENPRATVNCCCPGWVSTDMGKLVGPRPPKTTEEGARVPVRLALGNIDDGTGERISGRYWANESVRGKGEGQVIDG